MDYREILTQPLEFETTDLAVASTNPNAPDIIVKSFLMNDRRRKLSIFVIEKSGLQAVRLQPWVSEDGKNWAAVNIISKTPMADGYWEIAANGVEAGVLEIPSCKYFRMTGYVLAGTGLVELRLSAICP